MSGRERVEIAVGGVIGGTVALVALIWVYVWGAERSSERGFGA